MRLQEDLGAEKKVLELGKEVKRLGEVVEELRKALESGEGRGDGGKLKRRMVKMES